MKISRPDIHTTVEFLSILVRAPDKGNQNELLLMMMYLSGTPKIPPNIGSLTRMLKSALSKTLLPGALNVSNN